MDHIPFEKPIVELEIKISELRKIAARQGVNLDDEISKLEKQAHLLKKEMFSRLSAYEMVQLSRHPKRPNTLSLIKMICSEFNELHGDRNYYDDSPIVCGLAKIQDRAVVIIGNQKGSNTKEKIARNFGMAKPEGYRKALRIMSLAERFSLPIITIVDTPGAYPGVGAEERGQSEAIGKNIMVMSKLKVPIISIISGEGGSGGAMALAVGNRVHMMEYATYTVISPEACSSILMKNTSQAKVAAGLLKLTAKETLKLGVIDRVIPEPLGGGHRGPMQVARTIEKEIIKDLNDLGQLKPDELRNDRLNKFLKMGSLSISNV